MEHKTNKLLYKEFCVLNPEIPLFSQSWWLDLVCKKGQWNAGLSLDKNGNIIGALPYYQRSYYGAKVMMQPPLSPHFHIYLKYPDNQLKRHQKYAFERAVIGNLISQLPKVSYFSQRYDYTLTNWLPFYHSNFEQSTFYSYRIEDLSDLEVVFSGFKSNVRNKIRKAQATITIEEIDDIELFYSINQWSFQRQKRKMPYSLIFFKKLDEALKIRGQRKIYLAKDQQNLYHAAIYVAWDACTAYYLASGADTELRSSGAVQLLLWQAIQDAAKIVNCFDFEGSMLPGVESMFCDFGGVQRPYFRIRKAGNPLIAGVKSFLDGW